MVEPARRECGAFFMVFGLLRFLVSGFRYLISVFTCIGIRKVAFRSETGKKFEKVYLCRAETAGYAHQTAPKVGTKNWD